MKGPLGGNLVLASVLSLLSYVPFEIVAKGSLLVCVFLFIADPFPPHSRLVSLISTVVIGFLSRAHRNWQIQQLLDEDAEEQEMEPSLSNQQQPADTPSPSTGTNNTSKNEQEEEGTDAPEVSTSNKKEN
ncbi:expressed unknown protein [Seminavis robusta]|uniref:Uncharacterized protein n=1 Tax=Seminavis robusta TaxID=568900 RepID=A0A9N8DXZ0_9STRA|nr:expressed unknown protein [Seminavis robusta]|eukprot:Sro356_g125370.1 n/a (130) ;mRNA; f:40155-40544